MRTTSVAAPIAAALLIAAASAWAAPPKAAICPVDDPTMDRYEFLRSASLEVRGNVPTVAEYKTLDKSKDVPMSTLDSWLKSDAFAQQAVRVHRSLFWNSIENVRPFGANTSLRYDKKMKLWWRSGGAFSFKQRGNRVPCLDKPVAYDKDGKIVYWDQADGTKREGWVKVKPYWNLASEVKVCAGDAQAGTVSPNGTKCDQIGYAFDPSCGCGPNLRWCTYGTVQLTLVRSWAKAMDLQIRDIIKENRPYTDLFSEKVAYVNGPIVFFWKYQTAVANRLRFNPAPLDHAQLPYLKWSDVDKWVKVKLGPEHAGVLTSPAFLLRFQTNRARANRYYNTFLCQPFQPPESGIPVAAEEALKEPNLQKRPGCKYCHALLEPVASFWGRWTEQGVGFLNPNNYPAYSKKCEQCAKTGSGCTTVCKRYYFTKALSEPEKDFLGVLNGYVFLQKVHEKHVKYGPRLMAMETFADGRLPECMAATTAARMLGRKLKPDERSWAKKLSVEFAQSGYSYRALVKSILTSKVFRRVR